MKNNKIRSKQHGFSLIELLLALVISIATTGGLFSIYLNVRVSQDSTQANARIQESARFSLEYLKQDIRMIGYRGCLSTTSPPTNIVAKNMPAAYSALTNEIIGYDIQTDWKVGTVFETTSTTLIDNIRTGTNALSISRMTSLSSLLIQDQTSNASDIIIDDVSNLDITADDLIYISDCNNADIFRASSVNSSGGNITIQHNSTSNNSANLTNVYEEDATVGKYQTNFYYVGDTGRTNTANEIIYALYEIEIDYSPTSVTYNRNELIEGVENLQILYGEVLPTTSNVKYVTQDNVTNMQNVSSIQLGLLITSQENVRSSVDNNTYYLAQTAITNGSGDNNYANDRRLRHAFNTTIQIRNR